MEEHSRALTPRLASLTVILFTNGLPTYTRRLKKYLITFATAIADAPATATTNVAVLNGNIAGSATSVATKKAAAAPTIITRSLQSITLLLAAKPIGHRYTAPISKLAMTPAKTLPASPPSAAYPLSAIISIPNRGYNAIFTIP